MNVLYAATRNYYPYLKWAVDSLLEHNEASVYVMAEDDEVGFPCRVINVSGQEYFKADSPNMNTTYTWMSLMRVLAPCLLTVDKVLYLDVDTIVCENLKPMYETDLTGKWIAWCEEKRCYSKRYGKPYFNFGVALMNLEQMRKDNVSETLVHMLNTERFQYYEQCAMNRLTPPCKMVELDTRYNESFCTDFSQKPAIVHYAGISDYYRNQLMFRHDYLDKYRRKING